MRVVLLGLISCLCFITNQIASAAPIQPPEIKIQHLISHLKSFQQFADENEEIPGSRFIGTSGYDKSRNYVIHQMRNAGYKVILQDVPIDITFVQAPYTFELITPIRHSYIKNDEFSPFINSGSGNVTGELELPSGDISGCDIADFTHFTSGHIALIKRNPNCSAQHKVVNAVAAGASAVIIYSDTPGVLFASLGDPIPSLTTPAVSASLEIGESLRSMLQQGDRPIVHIHFEATLKHIVAQNIMAESIQGNPEKVIMVGAHLDSIDGNAGMNDNASAAASILEIALQMKNLPVKNKLRFAWWTGEEEGLLGSTYYMNHLSEKDKANIALYLNHEILGAPNGGRLIMGTAPDATSPGSEKITQLYVDYFKSQGLKAYVFDPRLGNAVNRSDMRAFIQSGIPVGYLVTGAELPWDETFAAYFTDLPNRIVGLAMHPCYHKTCDILSLNKIDMTDPNFDFDLYLQMSKAAAYAVYYYAVT